MHMRGTRLRSVPPGSLRDAEVNETIAAWSSPARDFKETVVTSSGLSARIASVPASEAPPPRRKLRALGRESRGVRAKD